MAKNSFRRSSWRKHGMMIDFINVILCVLILAAGIFLLIDVHKYMLMFPLIFLLSGIMNGCIGIKKYKMDEYTACIVAFLSALILVGLSIFTLIVVI